MVSKIIPSIKFGVNTMELLPAVVLRVSHDVRLMVWPQQTELQFN